MFYRHSIDFMSFIVIFCTSKSFSESKARSKLSISQPSTLFNRVNLLNIDLQLVLLTETNNAGWSVALKIKNSKHLKTYFIFFTQEHNKGN